MCTYTLCSTLNAPRTRESENVIFNFFFIEQVGLYKYSQVIQIKVKFMVSFADLPPQPYALCKCIVNLTGASVPGDASVYFRSFRATAKLYCLVTEATV